jgi:hypothetical protein
MEDGKAWNMVINIGGMAMNTVLNWENGNSGVYFNHIPVFSPSPSESSIQLVVDGQVLQELKFEIFE